MWLQDHCTDCHCTGLAGQANTKLSARCPDHRYFCTHVEGVFRLLADGEVATALAKSAARTGETHVQQPGDGARDVYHYRVPSRCKCRRQRSSKDEHKTGDTFGALLPLDAVHGAVASTGCFLRHQHKRAGKQCRILFMCCTALIIRCSQTRWSVTRCLHSVACSAALPLNIGRSHLVCWVHLHACSLLHLL